MTLKSPSLARLAAVLLVASAWAGAAAAEDASATATPAPALPAIARIEVEPATVVLHDAFDGRKVLVFGIAADGQRFDLTQQAKLTPDTASVRVDDEGFVYPARDASASKWVPRVADRFQT